MLPCVLTAQQSVTVDFESLPEGQAAGTQTPGYTFTNAMVLQSGVSLNEIEFPPRSGSKVVADIGGAMTIKFNAPVATFKGYFTHSVPLTVRAVDQSNRAFTQVSASQDNRAGSGGAPNEAVQVSADGGITQVTITGAAAGTSFTLDDMTLTAWVPPAPTFFIDTTQMTFNAVFGRQAPPAQIVTVTAAPDTAFTAVSSVPWLTAITQHFVTPANVAISANPAGMNPGVYYGSIAFSNTRDITVNVAVTLRIAGKPSLFSTPSSFSFRYRKGDPAPVQQLYVGANNANVDYFILTKDPWVKVTPDYATTGNLALQQQVTLDVTKLDAGHYESALYVYANEATNSPLTIPVTVDVTAATASAGGN
ncbi:MAG: hypothetical protein JST11_28580 [Acidobacteria bacterium]|nr:hypothetical protein [Acidobacteriota bacterium]